MSENQETNRANTSDWIWWSVLVLSCAISFGMTMFAPT